MYIDITLKKIIVMTLVVLMFAGLVYGAVVYKNNYYGSTPSFSAALLAIQETTRFARAFTERGFYNSAQFANALIGFSEQAASPIDDTIRLAHALPVLTYHRIVSDASDTKNVTESQFRNQMYALKDTGWNTVTLEEYRQFMNGAITLPEKSILITFDDGAKDSFYPTNPILAPLDYSAVVYLIAKDTETADSTYYLSKPEVERMLHTGRFEIGSHSYDGHRPYPTDAHGDNGVFFADLLWNTDHNRSETIAEFTERVRADLVHARMVLEKKYGVPITTFAFPFGNETGVSGTANFAQGSSITEQEASRIYDIGFLQVERGDFRYNYPTYNTFIHRRIHVDHDWDGARLIRELTQGLPKELPYRDDFSENKGWISAWGLLSIGRNNFTLAAEPNASSASALLDGSLLWKDYSFNASADWQNSDLFILAHVQNAKTYDACVFSLGRVQIQRTQQGHTTTLLHKKLPTVSYGTTVTPGIRVHGTTIECLWNFTSIAEVYTGTQSGGIGVQVWNKNLGHASVRILDTIAQSY